MARNLSSRWAWDQRIRPLEASCVTNVTWNTRPESRFFKICVGRQLWNFPLFNFDTSTSPARPSITVQCECCTVERIFSLSNFNTVSKCLSCSEESVHATKVGHVLDSKCEISALIHFSHDVLSEKVDFKERTVLPGGQNSFVWWALSKDRDDDRTNIGIGSSKYRMDSFFSRAKNQRVKFEQEEGNLARYQHQRVRNFYPNLKRPQPFLVTFTNYIFLLCLPVYRCWYAAHSDFVVYTTSNLFIHLKFSHRI